MEKTPIHLEKIFIVSANQKQGLPMVDMFFFKINTKWGIFLEELTYIIFTN
jgi:hypothetical protein